ncbi:MAG: ATP-dependent zinc metalloprotease FtsH [Synechocystis sp.]|nr:ATP-dependent zinc metalloprotease FtsH [Synechocystis sp.]
MVDDSNNSNQQLSDNRGLGRNLIILLLWLLFLNFFVFRGNESPQVPYSEFLQQVKTDQVATVQFNGNRLEYTLKPDAKGVNLTASNGEDGPSLERVTIPVVQDTQLPQLLQQHQVTFSALPSNGGDLGNVWGWILPPLIFIGIWLWFVQRSGGQGPNAFNVGKSKARIYVEGNTGITFEDVAGIDEARLELEEIVDFLNNASKYIHLGAKIPKGVLLVGPPGTGKTLLAKAIAGEAGVPFFSISGSEFIEMFVGVGASRVRDLFVQAKQQAPCIVFIDELDALGKSRVGNGTLMGSNDEREQTLNQLLSEMDGFEANAGVILLAATNRPEVLDPALLRPGRFDRQVVVDRPDKSGREAILRVHARNVRLAPEVDLGKLAARTPGFAGADLANLINEAALLAARQNHATVTPGDFAEAIERVLTGLEKKSRVLSELEKKTVAYHEVGHALIGALMPGAGVVEKISIVPRGVGALGYTLQLPEEDRFLMIEDELRGRIVTLLGGRAAEELVFGKVSTGASDDIQKATEIAERFVTLYGMSDHLGPVAFEKLQQQFLDGGTNPRRAVSPQVAEWIDQEVQTLIEGAHQMAFQLLSVNRDLLEQTARYLLDQEVLDGDRLKAQLALVTPTDDLNHWLLSGQVPHPQHLQVSIQGQQKSKILVD